MAEKIYTHESHDRERLKNDIAIIHLRKTIPLDGNVSLACLSPADLINEPLREGDALIASGWNKSNLKSSMASAGSQQVHLQYISENHPLCTSLLGCEDNQRAGQMCADFPAKPFSSFDNGGSLVRFLRHSNGKTYWQQVGIVSQINNSGRNSNLTNLFTRVDYFNAWIYEKIRFSL